MKKIEAVIREEKLPGLRDVLDKAGYKGVTVFDVRGRGAQGGISLQWRVGEYKVDLLPKKMIMLVVNDEDCQKVVDLICEHSKTGAAGDGKIFISTVEEVIRIRTSEKGISAI